MSKKILCTIEEATKEVNKRRNLKHVKYGIFSRPHLPTTDNKYFPGLCLVIVSKKAFLKAISDSLRHFQERGAKIELTIPEDNYESFCIG